MLFYHVYHWLGFSNLLNMAISATPQTPGRATGHAGCPGTWNAPKTIEAQLSCSLSRSLSRVPLSLATSVSRFVDWSTPPTPSAPPPYYVDHNTRSTTWARPVNYLVPPAAVFSFATGGVDGVQAPLPPGMCPVMWR